MLLRALVNSVNKIAINMIIYICVDKYNEVSAIHGIVGYKILDIIDDNHSFKDYLYIYFSAIVIYHSVVCLSFKHLILFL